MAQKRPSPQSVFDAHSIKPVLLVTSGSVSPPESVRGVVSSEAPQAVRAARKINKKNLSMEKALWKRGIKKRWN